VNINPRPFVVQKKTWLFFEDPVEAKRAGKDPSGSIKKPAISDGLSSPLSRGQN
jgi:hypothetical protein